MATQKIDTIAAISKVTRNAGKTVAQIVITIPAEHAGSIPLGNVRMTLEESQQKLDLGAAPRPIRGNRG